MSKDSLHSYGAHRLARQRDIRRITTTEKCKTAILVSSTKEWSMMV